MTVQFGSAISLVAIAILAACAPAADDAGAAVLTDAERNQVEQDLLQMENDWVAAYQTGDFTAFDRIFADDFIYTVNDGKLIWTARSKTQISDDDDKLIKFFVKTIVSRFLESGLIAY